MLAWSGLSDCWWPTVLLALHPVTPMTPISKVPVVHPQGLLLWCSLFWPRSLSGGARSQPFLSPPPCLSRSGNSMGLRPFTTIFKGLEKSLHCFPHTTLWSNSFNNLYQQTSSEHPLYARPCSRPLGNVSEKNWQTSLASGSMPFWNEKIHDKK